LASPEEPFAAAPGNGENAEHVKNGSMPHLQEAAKNHFQAAS
jgi:hypothetical protein